MTPSMKLPPGAQLADDSAGPQLPPGATLVPDQPEQSFGAALREYGKQMNPVTIAQGAAGQVNDVLTGAKGWRAQNEAIAQKAEDSWKQGDYAGAVRHGINYLLNIMPGLGAWSEQTGKKLETGDVAGAVGDMAAFASQAAIGRAAPEIASSEPVQAGVAAAKAGIKAGAPDLAAGATKVGLGYAMDQLPLPPEVRYPLAGAPVWRGARQMGRGAKAALDAVRQSLAARTAAPAAETAAEAAPAIAKTAGQQLAEADNVDWGKLSASDRVMYEHLAQARANTAAQAPAEGAAPAQPQFQPRALLPAGPQVTAMPPAEFTPESDTSFVRSVPAGRGVVRGANGRMMRQYSSTDQPLTNPVPAPQPGPAPDVTPEETSAPPAPQPNGVIRPQPGFSMGEMAQPRTDYNPAALSDEEIAALNQPKPNGQPAQPEIPPAWQRQPGNGNGRLSRTAAQDAQDFQVRARNRKVNALARFLYDGNGEMQAGQGLSVEEAMMLNGEQWNFLAKRAGINNPSPITIRQTIERLHQLYQQPK